MTNEEAVNRMITILREMETLRLDAKALREEMKEADLDTRLISKVARLIAKEREAEFVKDTSAVIQLLEEVKGT